MLEIPLTNSPAQEFSIEIDGVVYQCRAYYNTRQAIWLLDINDENDVDIKGIGLVGGADVFRQHSIPIRNAYVVNIEGSFNDATVDNLGSGVILVLITEDELEAL